MTTEEVTGIVARATALLLLLLAVSDLIYSVPDVLAVVRHWQLAAKGLGEIYWVRYYMLFLAGRILSAGLMLYVANELRKGSPKLKRYLAGSRPSLP